MARGEFQFMEQRESETLIAWHARLRSKFVRAYPDVAAGDVDANQTLRDRFLAGLRDRYIARHTYAQRPANYTDSMIAKEANHFIFKANWAGTELSVEAFKNWLRSDEEPEEALAYRINKIFDHRIRLGIMSILMVNEHADFNRLKELLNVTDGNLASHIKALEKVNYILVEKQFIGKKPNTRYRTTKLGKEEFKRR